MAKKKQKKLPPKKSNRTIVYAGLVLLVIAALIIFYAPSHEKLPSAGKYVKLNKPGTFEPGKVKMIEFLKFNCGHCNSLNQQLPAIEKNYSGRLEIDYRPMLWKSRAQELPFKKSIEAYIIAERMGKGGEMRDALFRGFFVERKDLTSEIVLSDIARSAGLGDEFVAALKNGDAEDEAEADIKLAEDFKVDETPTIIINGNIKVTPSMTNGDMDQMADNLNTIISSLLS